MAYSADTNKKAYSANNNMAYSAHTNNRAYSAHTNDRAYSADRSTDDGRLNDDDRHLMEQPRPQQQHSSNNNHFYPNIQSNERRPHLNYLRKNNNSNSKRSGSLQRQPDQ
jgi:hypothetical protein